MMTWKTKKTVRRERLARTVDRLGNLQLILNPRTKKMEPEAEQEKTVLEVVQTVKAAEERCQYSRETNS